MSFRVRGDYNNLTQPANDVGPDGAMMEISKPNGDRIPKSGYLVENGNSAVYGNIAGKFTDNNYMPDLPYGEQAHTVGGVVVMEQVETADNNNNKYIGHIGYQQNPDIVSRSSPVLTSVGVYLNQHFQILKSYIIKWIIKYYNNPDLNDPPRDPPLDDNKIINMIKRIKGRMINIIKDKYNIADNEPKINSILFTTIGKLADEIITNHIKYSIHKSSVKYIKSILHKSDENMEYGDILREVTHRGLPGQNVFDIDIGFKLNLNKLFDEIISTFYEVKNSDDNNIFNRLKYTSKIMKDEEKLPEQHQIYTIDYDKSNIVDLCYRIKSEIVNELVKHRSNVDHKDATRSTPIFYAINALHKDLVKNLTDNNATVYRQSVKNSSGFTPLLHATYLYSLHNSYVYDSNPNLTSRQVGKSQRQALCRVSGGAGIQLLRNLQPSAGGGNSDIPLLKKLYMPFYNDIKKKIEAEPKYGNNIIQYLDNIFPQTIIIYNNMFYQMMSTYVNNWLIEDFNKLVDILDKYNIVSKLNAKSKRIPLLDANLKDALKYSSDVSVLSYKNKELNLLLNEDIEQNDEYEDIIKEIKAYNNQITNLDKEIEELENKQQRNEVENDYLASIRRIRTQLDNKRQLKIDEKNNLIQQKNNISTNIDRRITYMQTDEINGLKNRINNFLGSEHHINTEKIVSLYNNIFKNVINDPGVVSLGLIKAPYPELGHNDFGLYNKMWDMYIKNNEKMKNITNIHIILVMLQSKIINKIKSATTKNEFRECKEDLESIKRIYDKIFSFVINNYKLLPQTYNERENIFMVDVIDIITHTTTHTICGSLYHAIIKVVLAYVISISPKDVSARYHDGPNVGEKIEGVSPVTLGMYHDTNAPHDNKYNEYVQKILDRIVQTDYDATDAMNKNPSLMNYITKDMPILIVKHLLDIYGVDDGDKELSLDKIFEPITDILQSTQVIPIKEDSSLITNINEHIFPYYKYILTQIVPKLKTLIDNYNSYILNDMRHIDIMIELLSKTIKEL